MSSNAFKTVIDIDLMGTFHVLRASYEFLRKPGASVISITAGQAVHPSMYQSHVCAAKAGILGLTRALVLEIGRHNVTVNNVAPSMTRTAFINEVSAEHLERTKQRNPMGRIGEVDDLISTYVFLASEDIGYLTGQCLSPSGGGLVA